MEADPAGSAPMVSTLKIHDARPVPAPRLHSVTPNLAFSRGPRPIGARQELCAGAAHRLQGLVSWSCCHICRRTQGIGPCVAQVETE